jgi:hypothetical protein
MTGQVTRGATAVVLAAGLAVGASGCSDDGNGGGSSAVSKAASAASSAASRGADALASATAEARDKLDAVKGGVDAKGAVKLGSPGTDDNGRTTVTVTADNTADAKKSFAVQVDFRGKDGSLLDTVVVTVPDVAAKTSKTATARSTHKLSGSVKAEVGTALRY